MNKTINLIIKNSEIINGELLIKKFAIIDGVSGEELRIAKITPELKTLIDSIEIDITDFMHFQEMKKRNPELSKLVKDFNLILI